MSAGEQAQVEGLLREVMAVLRPAYDLGRADALREAAAMLASAAPPGAAPGQRQVVAPPISRRRGPEERRRTRGRPDSLTEERRAAAAALLAEGRLSRRGIAQEVGVPPARLYRWLKEDGGAG